MPTIEALQQIITDQFSHLALDLSVAFGELTVEVPRTNLLELSQVLHEHPSLSFDGLMDLCGVDYLTYGISEWETNHATTSGFERAVDKSSEQKVIKWDKPRFAVVYHLLSTTHNHRVRMKVFLEDGEPLLIDTVINIWPVADWFEREAFDLYGIVFEGHPDLRRILTDYGFKGHPFRKDFPLIGEVEVRYDATAQRVVYEPVSIEPRVLVPKVIEGG